MEKITDPSFYKDNQVWDVDLTYIDARYWFSFSDAQLVAHDHAMDLIDELVVDDLIMAGLEALISQLGNSYSYTLADRPWHQFWKSSVYYELHPLHLSSIRERMGDREWDAHDLPQLILLGQKALPELELIHQFTSESRNVVEHRTRSVYIDPILDAFEGVAVSYMSTFYVVTREEKNFLEGFASIATQFGYVLPYSQLSI